MSDLVGQTLGRYHLVERIGAGGMGVVYRARDTQLGRDVAVKILAEAVADDPGRLERFEREARAVAKLSHPNILEIHDFGHEGEVAYAVTELLEGETLRERLGRAPLDWRAAAAIAADIADGLAAAHERGVVHRDLKPGNLFLTTDGRVKILDFGLAKLSDETGPKTATQVPDSTITQQGAVLGSTGYMSPEQVRGHQADHRSDIFSLGCVMYEMAAGRRAFQRDSGADTMAAILTEEPEELSAVGAEVPPELEHAIRRSLHKAPESRFQSANDLAYVLREIVADSAIENRGRRGPAKKAAVRLVPFVAVALLALGAIVLWLQSEKERLPVTDPSAEFEPSRVVVAVFDNRTGDPALDHLGLQIADAITDLLHQVEGVDAAVNPHGSPARSVRSPETAGTDPLLKLAEATGAGLVVAGAYDLRGPEVELRAKIVDPRRLEVVQTFDPVRAPRADPSPAIESVRQRVAGIVGTHFVGRLPFGATHPMPLAAWQEVQRSAEIFGSDFPAAVSHAQRALEIDSEYTLARAWLATVFFYSRHYPEAEAQIALLERDLPGMTPFEKALVGDLRAGIDGRSLGMLSAYREVVRLAPTRWNRLCLGYRALWANRPQEAVDALEEWPHDWWSGSSFFASEPFSLLAQAYHMLGQHDAELQLARESLEHFPDVAIFYGLQVDALAAMGRFDELDALVNDCLSIPARRGTAGSTLVIAARELRAHGHREKSIELAERIVAWCRTRPARDSLRSRMTLADALGVAERWREARSVAEGLVHEEPDRLIHQRVLGVLAARTGDRVEAERIAAELAALDRPYLYGQHTFARACIAAHLGERERAVALIRDAFSQGFRFSSTLHSLMEVEPLWAYPPFQELIAPKG